MTSTTNMTLEMCKNSCGFFGSTAFDGFCSQCYSEQRKKSKPVELKQEQVFQEEISLEKKAASQVVIESGVSSSAPVENLSVTTQSKSPGKNSSSKKTRCPNCQKITGILLYPCACGGEFCSNCRYSTEHQCPIDYKSVGRKILAKSNPPVIADRVHNRQ